MYTILSGNRMIYDSRNKNYYPCTEPELNLEMGEAGSLSFTLLPGHPMRNSMKEMQTFVAAYQDDETNPIFYGRVLMAEEDLYGRLALTCEGALTFLLDSEMEPGTYTETITAFFTRCVEEHNSMVEEAKQFEVGIVEHDDANASMEFKLEGYNQTRNVLDNLLVKKHGGFLRVRYQNGQRYLDFIQVFINISNQPLKVGYNLQNVQKHTNGENIFTILRPLGKDDLTIANASVSNLLTGATLVHGKYLTEPEESSTVLTVPYFATVVAESGSTVNLRQSPSTSSSIIVRVPLGQEVEVFDDSTHEGWWQVEYDGNTGYMMSQFLTPTGVTNEEEVEDEDWCYTSDYISVDSDAIYTSGPGPVKVNCYDSDHGFLYMQEDGNETSTLHYIRTPAAAAYVKVSFKEEYATEQQLHKGKLPILTKFDVGSKTIILPERRAKYGQIIHSERFSEITDAQQLYNEAIKWISRRYATLPLSLDCGIVDMHLLNPNIKAFDIGDVYDSIEGFANEIMTVCSIKKDMENPANDQLTLKNMAEIFGTDGGGGASGSMSSKYAKSKK